MSLKVSLPTDKLRFLSSSFFHKKELTGDFATTIILLEVRKITKTFQSLIDHHSVTHMYQESNSRYAVSIKAKNSLQSLNHPVMVQITFPFQVVKNV